MERRAQCGFTLVELLLIVAAVALVAAVIMPVMSHNREAGRRSSCHPNVHQLALGLEQYRDDYNGRYPPVAIHAMSGKYPGEHPYGWADAIIPYTKSIRVFICVSVQRDFSDKPMRPGFTDFWFNRNLAGVELDAKTRHAASLLLLGDGNDGKDRSDARYSLRALPLSWLTEDNSPARRHLGGANYAFADGHVKFFLADEMGQDLQNGNVAFVP